MNTEISMEEKIEMARSRLKTAYDLYQSSIGVARENYRIKWEERKKELNQLLVKPQNVQL